MSKLKLILIPVGVLLSLFLLYYYSPIPPKAFLTEEEIKEEINLYYNEISINEIQDIIFLDRDHVFVPYITTNGVYAVSYWKYENHQWRNEYIGTIGSPLVVNIGSKTKDTYLLWNINPNDHVSTIDFYLMKDRNYHVTNGIHRYQPKIQIKYSVDLTQQPYSALKVPDVWDLVMTEHDQLLGSQTSKTFFRDIYLPPQFQIGWIAYDKDGELTFPGPRSGTGHGGDNNVYFANFIDPLQLER